MRSVFPDFYSTVEGGRNDNRSKFRMSPTNFRYGCIVSLESMCLWFVRMNDRQINTFQSSSRVQVPVLSSSCHIFILHHHDHSNASVTRDIRTFGQGCKLQVAGHSNHKTRL